MSAPVSVAEIYDEFYYRHGCGTLPYERNSGWLKFFAGIAERMARDIRPRTVLDAGCAMGFLVEGLRDRTVQAFGVDVSDYALSQVREDIKPYCWQGSILDTLPQSYDLIVCIEVLEHLPRAQSEAALVNLCRYTDDVLFSSSPHDYQEATHFNVQPPEYWAEQFAWQGFIHDVDFDASFITPWATRFRRSHEPLPRVTRDYERRFWQVWKENVDLRQVTLQMREQLAAREHEAALKEQDLWQVIQEKDALARDLVEVRGYLAGRAGRWVQRLDRMLGRLLSIVAPLGSRRERWLRAGWRGLLRMTGQLH